MQRMDYFRFENIIKQQYRNESKVIDLRYIYIYRFDVALSWTDLRIDLFSLYYPFLVFNKTILNSISSNGIIYFGINYLVFFKNK